MDNQTKIEITNSTPVTYGVRGDVNKRNMAKFKDHRIRCVSGSVDVASMDKQAQGDGFVVINSLVAGDEWIYELPETHQFQFTGVCIVTITHW